MLDIDPSSRHMHNNKLTGALPETIGNLLNLLQMYAAAVQALQIPDSDYLARSLSPLSLSLCVCVPHITDT
jgi:hypothetical protein